MTDLVATLQDFYRDKLTALQRHVSGAEHVAQYDFNNAYQYIVNRDETQLSWVGKALEELGGPFPEVAAGGRDIKGSADAVARTTFEEDARDAQALVDRWRPRVAAMTNARHAKMLNIILGEVLEQKRMFEQALAGRTDLLGRRAEQLGPAFGSVLPTRWIE